jgi:hypothetical protein
MHGSHVQQHNEQMCVHSTTTHFNTHVMPTIKGKLERYCWRNNLYPIFLFSFQLRTLGLIPELLISSCLDCALLKNQLNHNFKLEFEISRYATSWNFFFLKFLLQCLERIIHLKCHVWSWFQQPVTVIIRYILHLSLSLSLSHIMEGIHEYSEVTQCFIYCHHPLRDYISWAS